MFRFFRKNQKKPDKKSQDQVSSRRIQSPVIRDDRKTIIMNQKENDEKMDFEKSHAACGLHIGTRQYQQDALYLSEARKHFIYGILCDGMGGMEQGDRVSNEVVTYIASRMETIKEDTNIPSFYEQELSNINQLVRKENEIRMANAGTTFTSVVILHNRLYWAAVGDSRIYLIREDEIVQITRDHNYAMRLKEQVIKGEITEEEAMQDPQREALISYIGAPVLEVVDISQGPFLMNPGDSVLLCSDGLTKSLTDEKILALVRGYEDDPREAVHQLIHTAFDTGDGSKDNTSVILIRYPYLV